jgi:hypothetical protein
VAARRRSCDAVDRTLRLRAAPPPPAPLGGQPLAPAGAGYTLTVPSGFAVARFARDARIADAMSAASATLLKRSWENTIAVVTTAVDAGGYRPPDGAGYCRYLERQFPRSQHRLEPGATLLAGHRAASCTITLRPGLGSSEVMMADQRARLVIGWSGNTAIRVNCSETAAQRAATERACDEVLRTVTIR